MSLFFHLLQNDYTVFLTTVFCRWVTVSTRSSLYVLPPGTGFHKTVWGDSDFGCNCILARVENQEGVLIIVWNWKHVR